jgi:hypothetical protein
MEMDRGQLVTRAREYGRIPAAEAPAGAARGRPV